MPARRTTSRSRSRAAAPGANPRLVVSALGGAGGAAAPILSLTQLVPLGTVQTLTGLVTIPAGVNAVVIELRDEVDVNTQVHFDRVGLFDHE